jgi:hypothetical protein
MGFHFGFVTAQVERAYKDLAKAHVNGAGPEELAQLREKAAAIAAKAYDNLNIPHHHVTIARERGLDAGRKAGGNHHARAH